MPLFTSRIVANQEIARDYYQLDFSWPESLGEPDPGQFFTVRVNPGPVPLLRRPFGFSGLRNDGVASTIYWRRGPATRTIASFQPGDEMDILAPLGNGFPAPAPGAVPVLLAGGVGIGPILYLANRLAHCSPAPLLLVGARSRENLPELDLDSRVQLRVATDDGSKGFHGTVVALAKQTIDITAGTVELYLCGPLPMLCAGHTLAAGRGLAAWVAMEQMMGCAVGACMGCAVPVHGEHAYARVCTEGPVFASDEIVWERLD